MKKITFYIVVLLILSVFNFDSEASAATKRTFTNQKVTAYTGLTSGHGSTYGYYNVKSNTVAVKKNGSNQPIIPFGVTITTSSAIYLPLSVSSIWKSSFTVTDTGPGGGNTTPYWFDVYYGLKNATNDYYANQFGVKPSVTYSATY